MQPVWLSSRLSRSVETRRRYGWLRMVFRGACLFRAPIFCPSGGGGTREAGNTIAESLVELYRVGTYQVRRGRRAAHHRQARGVLSPCVRNSKVRTGMFLREKLISDHSLFSSYEGRQGAANGQDLWGFFRDAQGFGRLDAGLSASFTSSRPPTTMGLGISILFFSPWCVTLRNAGLLIKTDWSVICPLCC